MTAPMPDPSRVMEPREVIANQLVGTADDRHAEADRILSALHLAGWHVAPNGDPQPVSVAPVAWPEWRWDR